MSKISLEILKDNNCGPELENFIASSANGTLFHSPRFLSYHGEEKFQKRSGTISHLLFRKGRTICGFMPGMILRENDTVSFNSPYGASYGSFVTPRVSFDQAGAMLDQFMNFLAESGVHEANLVPVPPCYSKDSFQDFFQYLLLSRGFSIKKTELLIVCRLGQSADYPHCSMDKGAKHAYKQAERKGVQTARSEDFGRFYDLLEKNLSRFQKKPTHTLEEILRIHELFPERLQIWLATLEDRAIAGALILLTNDLTANCFYVCSAEEYSSFRGTSLAMKNVLEWLSGQGFQWMDWGPSSFGYEPHVPLIRFKESFGGLGVLRYYLHLDCRKS